MSLSRRSLFSLALEEFRVTQMKVVESHSFTVRIIIIIICNITTYFFFPCTRQTIAASVTTMTTPLATHDTSTVRSEAGRDAPDSGDDGFIGGMRPGG